MIDPFRFAPWVSMEAAATFARDIAAVKDPGRDVPTLREYYDKYNRRLLSEALEHYPVEHREAEIGGVRVHVVTPMERVAAAGILLCLHGGAFLWGRGAGALLEAVPVACATGMRTIAIEYALAPEQCFPAAVEDVLAVYAAVRDDGATPKVGIYGCSAGGILTAQVVARLAATGESVPEAVAMLCGAGLEFDGDSAMMAAALSDQPDPGDRLRIASLPYFAGADFDDPLVFPGNHPSVLAGFPPTMLVTGSRDFASSAVTVMHRRLLAAGAEATLLHFDGMWHAYHMATTLPEARETFAALASFFAKHLA